MTLTVYPSTKLHGEISLPGDKSISHRAALFAALAQGESKVNNFLVSGVTSVMLENLELLGISYQLENTTLSIRSQGIHQLHPPKSTLDCGNSATTMRLLAGLLAAAGLPASLDGSPSLRLRPMSRIIDPLRLMGVPISGNSKGHAPLILHHRPPNQKLQPLMFNLPVASAQVKTTLILAALGAEDVSTLSEPFVSRDHTERMLARMGANITRSNDGRSISIQPLDLMMTPVLKPLSINIPGDISSAAFLIVAALISPGAQIKIMDVGINKTRTGLIDVLVEMGADIQILPKGEHNQEPIGDLLIQHSNLKGVEIAGETVVRMIDEFPAFAVAAIYASGKTIVREAQELRHKESDRIASLCLELEQLDIGITETVDGFVIQGGLPVEGGQVHSHGDHRLAMALAILGINAKNPITVMDSEIISESFPGFINALTAMGVNLSIG